MQSEFIIFYSFLNLPDNANANGANLITMTHASRTPTLSLETLPQMKRHLLETLNQRNVSTDGIAITSIIRLGKSKKHRDFLVSYYRQPKDPQSKIRRFYETTMVSFLPSDELTFETFSLLAVELAGSPEFQASIVSVQPLES